MYFVTPHGSNDGSQKGGGGGGGGGEKWLVIPVTPSYLSTVKCII